MQSDDGLIRSMELMYRQFDLNYQHAVCDAHPELEHLRPAIKVIGGSNILDSVLTIDDGEPVFDPYPVSATSMKDAAHQIAYKYGITVQQLIGKGRQWSLRNPRAEFVHTCRAKLSKTYPEIASYMGDRDHTSVLHYFRLATKKIAEMQVAA